MSNLADLELVAPGGAEAEVAALGLGGPRRRLAGHSRTFIRAGRSETGDG